MNIDYFNKIMACVIIYLFYTYLLKYNNNKRIKALASTVLALFQFIQKQETLDNRLTYILLFCNKRNRIKNLQKDSPNPH